MAFKAGASMEARYQAAKREARALRRYMVDWRAKLAHGPRSGNEFRQTLVSLRATIAEWDAAAATPGIVQYARAQEADPAYDVVSELAAMRAAAVAVRDWIYDRRDDWLPTGANYTRDGDQTVPRMAQAVTGGLPPLIDALIATIEE